MFAKPGSPTPTTRTFWDWAGRNGHTLVTADADFVALAEKSMQGQQVIHLERCDYPFRVIEEWLRQNAIRIAEFEREQGVGVLSLRL